jgi:hypothetical protein
MKKIATLIAVLSATAAFAAEPTTATATATPAPVKVEKKAEVKPHKSTAAKANKKPVTATKPATVTAPAVK